MTAPADPVRNPRGNLRTVDSGTAFMCQASFSAATLSPTVVDSYRIRPPPSNTSVIRKGYPDRRLLALPTFKNCQSALQSNQRNVLTKLLPIQLDGPLTVARFVAAHGIKHGSRCRDILLAAFGKIGINAFDLCFKRSSQRQNLPF